MNAVSAVAPNPAIQDRSCSPALSSPLASANASSYGPSVTVDFSENAKAALAAANENQNAANHILAFVDANRTGHSHWPNYASRDWSDGEPSLEQEYQQLTGNFSRDPNGQQSSQSDVLTITFSESASASLTLKSGSGAGVASAESTQYNAVSLSVNLSSDSIQIVQSNQSQIETAVQTAVASPVSLTA